MSEGDCLISPFFESASNILLDSLFREDRPPTDFQLGNSVNNDIDLFDNYEGHLTRSISIPNEQGNSDSLLPHCIVYFYVLMPLDDTPYSYGMNYQNRSREPPSETFYFINFVVHMNLMTFLSQILGQWITREYQFHLLLKTVLQLQKIIKNPRLIAL